MASGDNARIWFPVMLGELRKIWRPDMTWQEMNEICLQMGKRLVEIRKEKGISTKTNMPCKCGCGGMMEISSKISIRSLLFSLNKIAAISEEKLNELDKSWKSYQRKNKLNAFYEPKKA
jgi:hypothetical protein